MKKRWHFHDGCLYLFTPRFPSYICREQISDQLFPGVHVARQQSKMRRAIPIAFRDGVVEGLARKTLAALASQYPGESGEVLAESLGIQAPVLTRWEKNCDLSFPMLAQVLMVTTRDWTDLKFRDGSRVIDDAEAERLNMAGLQRALEKALELEAQRGSVSDVPHERAIACLVLLWRWGPANDRASIDWVWSPESCTEPPTSYQGPDPEQNDPDEERQHVRDGRMEASSQIQSFLAQELNLSNKVRRSKRISNDDTRPLLANWVNIWGSVAFDTFDIVREFCVDPCPH